MARNNRGVTARVSIDGEKQYKAAIEAINSGNKVLGSEMRKLQAQFEDNAESTEFLTKKGELLDRQLLQQKDKVDQVRKAYENSQKALSEYISKNGASGEQYEALKRHTEQWEVQLNNATAAQYKLEAAIRENNGAMEDQDDVMGGLGDTVSDLANKLGIRLPENATKALNSFSGLSVKGVAAFTAIAGAAKLAVDAVKAMQKMTLEAAAGADDLLTESMVSGLDTRTLQQLQYAENLIDVSYSTISGSLTKLVSNMDAARDGNEKLAESFKQLGVPITDTSGTLRDSQDVFNDVIDALGKVQNASERDALAMEIFGKSAQELNPLIIQGSDALGQFMDQAVETGYVLDESQVEKLGEVDDAYQKMQLQLEATKKEISLGFAPISIAAMEAFSSAVKFAGDTVGKLAEAGQRLKNSLLVTELRTMGDQLGRMLGIKKDNITTNENGTFAQGGNWYNPATGQWEGNYYASLGPMDDYFYDKESGRIWNLTRHAWVSDEEYRNQIYGYNATGNDNWRGGLTWVGENGPELAMLPRGTQILNAQESRGAGGDVFNITIDARSVQEFNDIIEIARSARVRARMR